MRSLKSQDGENGGKEASGQTLDTKKENDGAALQTQWFFAGKKTCAGTLPPLSCPRCLQKQALLDLRRLPIESGIVCTLSGLKRLTWLVSALSQAQVCPGCGEHTENGDVGPGACFCRPLSRPV